MSRNLLRRLGLLTLFAITLAAGWVISGEPARDRIIESATVKVSGEQVMLDVRLSFPFRYLSHFPMDSGSELRIRIMPVRVPSSDRDAVFSNEGMVPPDAEVAALDEVLYEGDTLNGPRLTIRFEQPVYYQVIPASDYRGVTIIVQGFVKTKPDLVQP